MAIVLLAPVPVGAPFAMSRLGNELVRAPAIPSNEIWAVPSSAPTSVTFATSRGFPKETPPSVDLASLKTRLLLGEVLPDRVDGAVAVRPDRAALAARPLVVANAELSVIGRDQVSPPSVEWLTEICSGPMSFWLLNCV